MHQCLRIRSGCLRFHQFRANKISGTSQGQGLRTPDYANGKHPENGE